VQERSRAAGEVRQTADCRRHAGPSTTDRFRSAEFQRAELRRVMLADKTKAVLLQEMAHRTKNNLVIRLEARHGGPEVAAALEATARRLQVMAEVYDHLSLKQDSRSVNMRYFLNDVVEKVFQSLAPSGPIAFKVVCEDVYLAKNHALAIGMITNELVTNSLKYGFPCDRPGHIVVAFSSGRGIELSVSDNGVGLREGADPGGRAPASCSCSPSSWRAKSPTSGWIRVCASKCGRIRVSVSYRQRLARNRIGHWRRSRHATSFLNLPAEQRRKS